MVANQRETRIKPGEPFVSEVLARQRRQQELARDQEQWREFQQRQKAEAAAKHTRAAIKRAEAAARQNRAKLALAQALEKMDKLAGALDFYKEIAKKDPNTNEGRLAAKRIEALGKQASFP